MKNILTFFGISLIVMLMVSCSSVPEISNEEQDIIITPSLEEDQHADFFTEREKNIELAQKQEIPTGLETFNKLASYIERNGFIAPQRGVPCDHQLTFFDSQGNRHALITIRRDANGNPATNAPITQISVWAYKDGIKDQDHFFGYAIDTSTVRPFSLNADGIWENQDRVSLGYHELIQKI